MSIIARCVALLLACSSAAAAQRARILPIDCEATGTPAPPALAWRGGPVQSAEWDVAVGARRVPVRIVAVQFAAEAVTLSLDVARTSNGLGPWTLDNASGDALVALNAGQFTDDGPWGWVMHAGREWQAPGTGALAGALVVDSAGRVTLVDAEGLHVARRRGGIAEAVQSYPMLLSGARVPAALCADRSDIDRYHRDTRLAVGSRADGSVVIALTRYDGAGASGARLPIGPTTPEMAEIMRRLGAVDALMLDGGLSSQLLVRHGDEARRWPGLRAVPLALVARAR